MFILCSEKERTWQWTKSGFGLSIYLTPYTIADTAHPTVRTNMCANNTVCSYSE